MKLETSLWRYRFAILVAVTTFPLVFVGGAVTSKNAGLAVPDWPLSFGSLNPPGWWRIDHVFYEHGHRILGTTVGFLVLIQAIWAGFAERRRALRIFAYVLLGGVVVQGILGGLRVTQLSTNLALVHGVLAHFIFAAMVVMAWVSSPRWPALQPRLAAPDGYTPRLAAATFAALVIQLVLGAVVRHAGVTVVLHVLWSLAVMALIHGGMVRVLRSHRDVAGLRIPAVIAAVLVVLQMGVGVAAAVVTTGMDHAASATLVQWAVPTFHVAVGAIMLALSAAMTVTIFQLAESGFSRTTALRSVPHDLRVPNVS